MNSILKSLATMAAMVCVIGGAISEGLAEEVNSATESEAGTAYEFSGLTKYFTIPSKYLFGNRELLGSDIVDGYRVDLNNSEEWRCIISAPDTIVLASSPTEWWSQPIYKETRLTEQDVPEETIVVLIPTPKRLDEIGCTQDISPGKFVVNETIAQKLLAKKKAPLEGG